MTGFGLYTGWYPEVRIARPDIEKPRLGFAGALQFGFKLKTEKVKTGDSEERAGSEFW